MAIKTIPRAVLMRLPIYLNYLKSLTLDTTENISATTIANQLSLGEVQVRKDLALISRGGKPKIGYNTSELIRDIEGFLGYDRINDAIIVGAGRLGRALLDYDGFKNYGLNVIAAFDNNVPMDVDVRECEKPIMHISKLRDYCKRANIKIGIISVPASSAQEVCNLMVESGILAILNFAPVHLAVSDDIFVQNENMAVPLVLLSHHLSEQMAKGKK